MKLNSVLALLMFSTLLGCGTNDSTSDLNENDGISSIQTSNYANAQLDYYYYIPPYYEMPVTSIQNQTNGYPLLALIPGLSGRGESFVTNEFKRFADDEGFVIISPSFVWDEKNWDSNESYQYPSAWSGDAFLNIIDHFEMQNNISVSSMYLLGYSAGAQFALRFCVWKPELCSACAAHASGGYVYIPEYIDVSFFVTVGKKDQDFRISNYDYFCSSATDLGIDVECRQYDVGHGRTAKQIRDSLEFIAHQRDIESQ